MKNILIPYLDLSKADILKDALESCNKLGLDFSQIFRNTLTSYTPDKDGVSFGETASDVERILAFHELGIEDPLKYKKSWEEVLKNAVNIENKYKRNKENV